MHTELQVLPVMQRQRVTVAGKTVIVETEPAAGGRGNVCGAEACARQPLEP